MTVELIDRIRYLVPDCKCSVWYTTDITEYHGESEPIEMDGKLVDWRGPGDLPTLDALMAVPEADILAKQEVDRKARRDGDAKKDMGIQAAYQAVKIANPSLTFTAFLDLLEAQGVTQ